jgi:hypothetical protein
MSLTDEPTFVMSWPTTNAGTRWFLGLFFALAAAAAFGGIAAGVSALWPAYFPMGAALGLTDVIGPGIAVTVVADQVPAGKVAAAWVVAVAFFLISAVSIVIAIVAVVHFHAIVGLMLFDESLLLLRALATTAGALVGLRAAMEQVEIRIVDPPA